MIKITRMPLCGLLLLIVVTSDLFVQGQQDGEEEPLVMMSGISSSRRESPSEMPMPRPRLANGPTPIAFSRFRSRTQASPAISFPGQPLSTSDNLPPDPEDTEEMRMEDMDIDMLIAVSSMQRPEDIASMLGFEMPEEPTMSDVDANLTTVDGISARAGFDRMASIETAMSATCDPENQTVVLDVPQDRRSMYLPKCVRLQRCGGCCGSPLLECQPTEYKTVPLRVVQISTEPTVTRSVTAGGRTSTGGGRRTRPRVRTNSNRRVNRRRRRQTSSYVPINVVHHTACQCQCKVKPQHCNPSLHTYVHKQCTCSCNNRDEKEKCDNMGTTHFWNNDRCQCLCVKEEQCSTGQYFEHSTCSCMANRFSLSARRSVGRSAAGRGVAAVDDNGVVVIAEEGDSADVRPSVRTPVVFQ